MSIKSTGIVCDVGYEVVNVPLHNNPVYGLLKNLPEAV